MKTDYEISAVSCPQLVMHEGFYCGSEGEFYMPKRHSLKECCYDGSHARSCSMYRPADTCVRLSAA